MASFSNDNYYEVVCCRHVFWEAIVFLSDNVFPDMIIIGLICGSIIDTCL